MFNSLILHIPHSQTFIPDSFGNVKDSKLLESINIQTDFFTDELFDMPESNRVAKIIFPFSRFYCDVERFWDDDKERMIYQGQGVRYDKYADKSPIECRVDSKNELKPIYDSHHRLLNEMSKKMIEQNGSCLIIDCHSFSSLQLSSAETNRDIDVCIGINSSYAIDSEILQKVISHFESFGLKVKVNSPYIGSIYPSEYRNDNLKSMMIEVNKRLYMKKPVGFEKNDGKFESIKTIINSLMNDILLSK